MKPNKAVIWKIRTSRIPDLSVCVRMKISESRALSEISCLNGQQVSHAWRGHGSAVFLELSNLDESVQKKYPSGDYTVMIEWSWRFEQDSRILMGSWSENDLIDQFPSLVTGKIIKNVSFFSRLKEIELRFTDGSWLLSFATAEGDTEWGVKVQGGNWLNFEDGSFTLKHPEPTQQVTSRNPDKPDY